MISAVPFTGVLILLGFMVFSGPARIIRPPIYEEAYSRTSALEEEIRAVDQALYASLYQREVAEKDIRFLKVEPRHAGGDDWDFTELQIRVPERKVALQLDKDLRHALSQVSPAVHYERERVSRDKVIAHVVIEGNLTHRIVWLVDVTRRSFERHRPRIALMVDDMGYDMDLGRAFAACDLVLSLSVLPLAPHTGAMVEEAAERERELILHLPMEPNGYPRLDPGPGALLTRMKEREIQRILRGHLETVSGIRGVNNHMGSRFTREPEKMGIVLQELKRKGLFYVDSRTTAQTVAFELAKKMGVPAAKRSVFLDNDLSPRAMRYQMERLQGIARHGGCAVGIGHPHRETLEILNGYAERLKREFEIVRVSELAD